MTHGSNSVARIVDRFEEGSKAPFESVDHFEHLEQYASLNWEFLTSNYRINSQDTIFVIAHPLDRPAPVHVHDYLEIAYVVRGPLINNVAGKRLRMLTGEICLMSPGSSHSLDLAVPDAVLANICIRPLVFLNSPFREFIQEDNTLARFLRGEGASDYLLLEDTPQATVAHAVSTLMRAYVDSDFHQSYSLLARTILLLCELEQVSDQPLYGIDEHTLEILDYLRQNCATVSVASAASHLGYSENYLSQYLKRHMGKTAAEVIRQARIAKANKLLGETSLPVEEVAHEVGFQSYSHFHRLFCSVMGLTPSEYRKKVTR